MNTTPEQLRPPGYWFGAIRHGLREKMRDGLTEFGLSRGEWRILHTLADGAASADEIEARLPNGERHRRVGARARAHGFGHGFTHDDDEHGGHHDHQSHDGRPRHDHQGHDAYAHAHGHGHPHGRGHGWDRDRTERGQAGRRHPRSVQEVLDGFAERAWIVAKDGGYELTDKGRAAHDGASARVRELRASITEGIDDADYATTIATLEKMARNLGWDE